LPLALKGGAQSENVLNTAAQEETDGFVRPHRFLFCVWLDRCRRRHFPTLPFIYSLMVHIHIF
jgi:hypothetical protein